MAEATPSGINDALLGGTTNTAADREAARRIAQRYPAVPEMARAGHEYGLSVAQRAAAEGIRGIIRAGYVTRIPGRNAHDVVHAVAPDARIVYVTRGDAAAMAAPVFGKEERVTVASARVAYPEKVLAAPPVAALLAEGEPVCLVAGMYYQNASEHWCRIHMAAYAAALPPGSVLAVSLIAVPGREDAAVLGELFGTPVYPHTAQEVGTWLDGAEVIPLTPGITEPGTALGFRARIS